MPSLTQEQKNVIKNLIKDIDNKKYVTLGGYAGTGKTTIIKIISDFFESKGKRFLPCAYTGKAANVLRKKKIHANTIHSTIYKPIRHSEEEIFWKLIDEDELGYNGFIVDEASMISKEIHEDLCSFGLPIIYVGDHGQLEPIGTSFNLMSDPDYKLETIHRNAGEIACFSEHLRKGKNCLLFKGSNKVQIVSKSAVKNKHLLSVDQVVCAFNKTRIELNNKARKEKGINISYLSKDEKVICLRNNKKQNLFNGMQGVVTCLREKNRFDFISNGINYEKIKYNPEQFGKATSLKEGSSNLFDYAYCITCHKAQGDQFDSLMVYEQTCDNWAHSRWTYTAASRAINSLIWVSATDSMPKYI